MVNPSTRRYGRVDGTRSSKSAFLTSVSTTEGTKLISQSASVVQPKGVSGGKSQVLDGNFYALTSLRVHQLNAPKELKFSLI